MKKTIIVVELLKTSQTQLQGTGAPVLNQLNNSVESSYNTIHKISRENEQ